MIRSRALGGIVASLVCAPLFASLPASAAPAEDAWGERGAANAVDGNGTRTRFGVSIWPRPGESYQAAFNRQSNTYGHLGVVRMYFPGMPSSWAAIEHNVGNSRVLVSFKGSPRDILSGRYDQQLREWFAEAPRERTTRWSYLHEPEDDIEAGRFTAAQYRQAWQHVNALADAAQNKRLRSTLTLMYWTLEQNSGRNWRDYYAGDGVIDVLAFDTYNSGYQNDRYRTPRELLGPASALSKQIDKPWGVAEYGSVVVDGDSGAGRGRWLRESAQFARQNGARFMTYFDSDVGTDYRLHDYPSRVAWRDQVTGASG